MSWPVDVLHHGHVNGAAGAEDIQLVKNEVRVVSEPGDWMGFFRVGMQLLPRVPRLLRLRDDCDVDRVGRDPTMERDRFVVANPVATETVRLRVLHRLAKD